jgi:hypothetical protein
MDRRTEINGKSKINFKGNGQERPFHTSEGNVNVKNGAACLRVSHFSQRTREMGHPVRC